MYPSALLDETDVKVVYDQQGNKREVLLSYEKYVTLVEFVKRYTRMDRQASPQVQKNAAGQTGWDIFNSLGRDTQPQPCEGSETFARLLSGGDAYADYITHASTVSPRISQTAPPFTIQTFNKGDFPCTHDNRSRTAQLWQPSS